MTIRLRLLLSYALVGAIAIVGMSLSARYFLEYQFQDFAKNRLETQIHEVVHSLEESLKVSRGWNPDSLSIIGMHALQQGLILRIQDQQQQVVWDARTHNDGMCQAMLDAIVRNMHGRYPDWKPAYQEIKLPVHLGDSPLLEATLGYYGPFFYSDAELYFLQSLGVMELASALVCLLAALAAGLFMSRLISQPLQLITRSTVLLRQGRLETRIPQVSGGRELRELGLSINTLAASLEDQAFLRRRMSSDISHELRTPLAGIQGSLEAMIDGIWPADQARLQSCLEEVMRLNRLVGQLEDLESAEKTSSEPSPDVPADHPASAPGMAFDLGQLCDRVCLNAQGGFAAKGLEFTWKTQGMEITSNPDHVSQILTNLLSNALKYTMPPGRVHLDMERQGPTGGVRIRVQDTGIGIPEAEQGRIFERFYRVDSSRTRSTGGAGIGLSIALALARSLGGNLKVESIEGQGSSFILELPGSFVRT